MHGEKHLAFVLNHVVIGDSRRILNVFTQNDGKRSGVFRVSKRNAVLLTPLNLVSLQISGKQHQDLKYLSGFHLEKSSFNLAGDYLGLALVHHWTWLIERSQPEGQADERVFRLIQHGLSGLQSLPKSQWSLANIYFEAWLLHFSGMLSRVTGPDSWEESEVSSSHDVQQVAASVDWHARYPVFQLKIEDFVAHALQYGVSNAPYGPMGRMWELFLSSELKSRKVLMEQFKERRFL